MPGQPLGAKGCQLERVNEAGREGDESNDGDDFDQHHDVVGFRRLADSANQNHRKQHDDDESGPVESEVPAGAVNHITGEVGKAAGQIGRRNPFGVGMDAEPIEKINQVCGKTYADGHVADGVFEDQVPTDDPGDEFAHGGVGVGVGAAGDGNHGRKFGVADGCEAAGDGDQDERERDGRACAGTAEGCGMMNEVLQQRCVEDGRGLKFLSGDSGANDGEDAGTDDRANAERGETEPAQRFFQTEFGAFAIGDELVNVLAAEEG